MTASPRWPIFFVLVALALPVAIVFATASAPAAENRDAVAVIIGNKNYPGDIPNVSYALNDAAAMKRFVIDVLGYREGNVIDLTDATKGQMETVFGTAQDYAGQLHDWARGGRSDIVVFYSGHGVPSLRNGRSYLLPVDGDPSRPEISGFPVDVLVDNLSKLGARSVTVYLDACFSGVSDGGVLVQSTSGIGISARMPDAAGVAVLTASQGDQVASWDNEARHGLFTENLLQALYGKADEGDYGDGDGRVTLAETKRYLDDEMTYRARRAFGREQEASITGSGEIILAAYEPGRPPERPAIYEEEPIVPQVAVESAAGEYFAVTDSSVFAEPDRNSAPIAVVARGAPVAVTGKLAGRNWYVVDGDGGRRGYVYGDDLAKLGSEDLTTRSGPKVYNVRPVRYRGREIAFAADIIHRSISQVPNSTVVRNAIRPDQVVVRAEVTRLEVRVEANPSHAGAVVVENLFGNILGRLPTALAPERLKVIDVAVSLMARDPRTGETIRTRGAALTRGGVQTGNGPLEKALQQAFTDASTRLATRLMGDIPPPPRTAMQFRQDSQTPSQDRPSVIPDL